LSLSFDITGQESIVRLDGEIGISCGDELKRILMEGLRRSVRLRIDAKGAQEFDLTVIQLLWAVRQECERRGVALTMDDPLPEALQRVLVEMGIVSFPKVHIAPPDAAREASSEAPA
jgi:MFS superfamily sulfate permease-like transporter